ncbi:MFS general substrate transporter [Lophium mytilinum]|uniref:MFS general substrate transporter n=1 Tax=Lophium mytilinum TaxID=390894 RepID=A0A6A6QLQ1_9PEZI|nr:MFS general substrate transporter [Lophium mytilinum]
MTVSNIDLASDLKRSEADISNPSFRDLKTPDVEKEDLDLDEDIERQRQQAPDNSIEQSGAIPGSQYNKWQWTLVIGSLYATAFLYGLDTTIVADIQAPIVETFGEVDKLGWLGIGFPLGGAATIFTLSRAFSLFDNKWLYLGSVTMFEAGSALCGGAPSMNALIVGRVWTGVGGAGSYLGVLTLVTVNTPIEKRPIYVSGIGAFWGFGTIMGPVIGGLFSDSGATWRWSFYINLVLFAIFLPALLILDSYQPRPDISFRTKFRQMDWLGSLLNAASWTSFVLLFTFGGITWAWDDGRTIALFVLCPLIILAFVITQYFSVLTTPAARIFPADFLRSRTLILLYIGITCCMTCMLIPMYYIPIFFAFARGDSGTDSAVRLLPLLIFTIFFIVLNGALLPKVGYYMPFYLISSIFAIIGGALMYTTVDAGTPNGRIYGYSVLLAVGGGLAAQGTYSIAAAIVEPHRVADSIGYINTAQIGGTTLALTITSSVFQNVGFRRVSAALQGMDFTHADIRAALAGARSAVFERADARVKKIVVDGIVDAIADGYILVIVAGAVGLVTALCMKREKLFLTITAA